MSSRWLAWARLGVQVVLVVVLGAQLVDGATTSEVVLFVGFTFVALPVSLYLAVEQERRGRDVPGEATPRTAPPSDR